MSTPPTVTWLDDAAQVRSLLYAGEPIQGRTTRVFFFTVATPVGLEAGSPAVIVPDR